VRRPACAVILALGVLASDVAGGDLDVDLKLSGSVREVAVATRGTDAKSFRGALEKSLPSSICVAASRFANCPAFGVVGERDVWQSLTRVRTNIDLSATDGISGRLVYDHELLFGVVDTLERGFGDELATGRFASLEDEIEHFDTSDGGAEGSWRHLLYRAWVRYEAEHVDLVLGRQRIPWGVGRLWNPIDRFNPIGPLAIEGDQSSGVDAVDAKWLLSGFTFLEAAYAPRGRAADASYALRLHGVHRDVDYSLMAGVFEEAWTAGLDLAGNLGDAVARVEAAYSDPERDIWPVGAAAPRELAAFWQVVTSIDTNLDIGSGLYVLVEHLYNGNGLGFGRGEAGPLLSFFESTTDSPPHVPRKIVEVTDGPFVRTTSRDRFGGSRVVSFADQLTGVQLGYELFTALRGEVLTIYDWDGTSLAFVPSLTYTPLGSLELTLGSQLFAGRDASEFGPAEKLGFLMVEWFSQWAADRSSLSWSQGTCEPECLIACVTCWPGTTSSAAQCSASTSVLCSASCAGKQEGRASWKGTAGLSL
jgi:hypothetical protein